VHIFGVHGQKRYGYFILTSNCKLTQYKQTNFLEFFHTKLIVFGHISIREIGLLELQKRRKRTKMVKNPPYHVLSSLHQMSQTTHQCLPTNFHMVHCAPPLSSARQQPSYGDGLEVKREYYQNCSVLACVTQCSQSAAHSCEQFLQVQQIRFVILGPLRCA